MATNWGNFSTAADLDDIFVLATAGEQLKNFGALTTSGDLASPIRVAADGVNVANFGSLTTSGDGSPGITVGDFFGPHYDNVTVVNYGSITTTGDIFYDGVNLAFADGIDVRGNNNTVINYGKIESGASGIFAGDFVEPVSNTHSNTVVNYGEIHLTGDPTGAGAGIAMMAWGIGSISRNYGTVILDGDFEFFVDGVDAAYAGSLAENYGQIYATADIAIGMGIFFGDNLLRNYGTIQIDGSYSVGMHLDGGNSRGENYGTVVVSDETSIGVEMGRLPHHPNIGGAEFTNYGTIRTVGTAVLGGEYDDVVTNRGLLIGGVSLEAGDDTYVAGAKGQLDGLLTLGAGDDLVIVERNAGELTIGDFVAGSASDDVIDLSAFGFRSFAQLMNRAHQSGEDVILDLGRNTELVLQNLTLASLSGDDFALI